MNKSQKISREISFLIYGAGEVGSECYQRLKKRGYQVKAALDENKNGNHIIEGIITYRLGTEPDNWNKSDYIVIISLANGLIHKHVADHLYGLGYCYFCFLPMGYCMPDAQKYQLTKDYNHVLFADESMEGCEVFHYEKYMNPDISIDTGILCRTSHDITAWMGLEMLFSESLELWTGNKSKLYTKNQYLNRNIASANPCEDLFHYYSLELPSNDSYFNSFKKQKTKVEKDHELKQRESLYRLFKREHERGLGFFIEGAPPVVWNPNSYFNLVGGHHRTLYLLHEGHALFPVKMKDDDFEKWCNEVIYRKLKQYIRERKIQEFYAPIPHPAFLNFPTKWEDCGHTKLAALMRFFAQEDLSDQVVLDCMDDEGYFARNFDRIGAKESIFLNDDEQQLKLADLFHQLLYRNKVVLKSGNLESCNGKYDIIFAKLEPQKNNDWISYLKFMGNCCRKYLILETTNEDEINHIQIYADMPYRVCIHKEYRYGKTWELGVYQK